MDKTLRRCCGSGGILKSARAAALRCAGAEGRRRGGGGVQRRRRITRYFWWSSAVPEGRYWMPISVITAENGFTLLFGMRLRPLEPEVVSTKLHPTETLHFETVQTSVTSLAAVTLKSFAPPSIPTYAYCGMQMRV